jgi:hypothetical protein
MGLSLIGMTILCLAGAAPPVKDYSGSHELYYFPIAVRNATVNQATLRIFLLAPLRQIPVHPLTLRVFQIDGSKKTLLDSKTVRLKETSRWVEMEVVPAVSSWISGHRYVLYRRPYTSELKDSLAEANLTLGRDVTMKSYFVSSKELSLTFI